MTSALASPSRRAGPRYRVVRTRASSVAGPAATAGLPPTGPSTRDVPAPDETSSAGSTAHRSRRKRGRPPLLDPPVRETLLAAIKLGCRPSVAAQYARISPQTLQEWVRRGRGEDRRPATRPYVELVAAIEQAEAEAVVYVLGQLHRAMSRSPKAAMWFLENRDPYWRQRHLRDALPPPVESQRPPQAMPYSNRIVVTAEQLEAIGLAQLGGLAPLADDDPRRRLIWDSRDEP